MRPFWMATGAVSAFSAGLFRPIHVSKGGPHPTGLIAPCWADVLLKRTSNIHQKGPTHVGTQPLWKISGCSGIKFKMLAAGPHS